MLIFTSIVMALGLVSLASDTGGILIPFVNNADGPSLSRGYNHFFDVFESEDIGLTSRTLLEVLDGLLMGI